MDIFSRTPAISEDTLYYSLRLPSGHVDKTSATTFAACIQSYVDALLPNFLWHRDAFQLKVVADSDHGDWMLEGTMRVGDCVDDEWCAVWLLKEISAKWDVVISMFDLDGEFLLIEAAEALPSWVKPSNSENRVWIYKSRLHLIPISYVSPPSRKQRRRRLPGSRDSDEENDTAGDDEDFITVEDAVKLVRDNSVDTLAPQEVENLVRGRISRYPEATRDHIQTTRAFLPVDIARALSVDPSLVQKPVETFYTRDAIQLRAAHKMSRFPPQPFLLTTVKMTRTAYAQLVGQKFHPPKIFGRWTENEDTKEWRWRDIGMKIAVGFEMLYQESKGRHNFRNNSAQGVTSSVEATKDALQRNSDYMQYIDHLASADYFKGETRGSQLWNALENKAASIFVNVRRDDAMRTSFASLVSTAISQAPAELPSFVGEEDSDAWLDIDVQDFDNMLERTIGTSKTQPALQKEARDAMDVVKPELEETAEERLASEQADRLRSLAEKVGEFVNKEGDLEGATFDDEHFSEEDEFSDDTASLPSENEHQPDPAARQAAMDRLVPALNASEYGEMPASFHTNSQRTAPSTIDTDIIEEKLTSGDSSTSTPGSRAKPIRKPILPRDVYDGVDSDDESGDDDEKDDPESEEDRPQVVGDIEVDMDQEAEEFLEFSRQALGITDEHWREIVRDRNDRGAFVPAGVTSKQKATLEAPSSLQSVAARNSPPPRTPAPGPRPEVNPNLDSFEAVMKAMDAQLALSKNKSQPLQSSASKDKGKVKATVADEEDDDEDGDIEAAMEAELKAALDGDKEDDDGLAEGDPVDYNLIKNFLESFKSQGGLSGPVSNLVGRLQPGWTLPRDS